MLKALALLIAIVPVDNVVRDEVDLIEINRFYDECCKLVFEQVLFYRWHEHEGRHHIHAWRMLKSPGQVPQSDKQNGGYVTRWNDTQEGGIWREVRCKSIRESWTQIDPELIDREAFPRDRRRGLSRPMNPVWVKARYARPLEGLGQ